MHAVVDAELGVAVPPRGLLQLLRLLRLPAAHVEVARAPTGQGELFAPPNGCARCWDLAPAQVCGYVRGSRMSI